MAITQNITNLPTPPQRTDPANFDSRADAFMASLDDLASEINTWAGQTNGVADEVEANAVSSESSMDDAEIAQAAAEAASQTALSAASETKELVQSAVQNMTDALSAIEDATVYAGGTTYGGGDVVFDSTDSYRLYTSQQGSNTGNLPSSDDGTWWEETLGASVTTISLNKNTIENAYVIPAGDNALSVGPLDINATVTINDSTWEIL